MSFVSKFVSDFKKGAAEEAAELGIAERRQADRDRRRRNFTDPVKAENEENKKLLEEAGDELEKKAGEIEALQAERDKLTVERDEAQTKLADNEKTLAALADQAEQWQAERDQLAEVLRAPGVRNLLINTYHSDPKTTKLSKAERKALDDIMAKINAAYDLIKTIDKEAKAAAEAAAQAKDEAESEE